MTKTLLPNKGVAAPVEEKPTTATLSGLEKTHDGRESQNKERERKREEPSSLFYFLIGFNFFNF